MPEWIGRVAQYSGNLYLLAAAIAAIRDQREWDPLTYSALRESNDRFRALAEATFEGIVISRNGIIIDTNEQFAQMLHLDREDLMGQSVASLIPKKQSALACHVLSGRELSVEHPIQRSDGSCILVECHGRTIQRRDQTLEVIAVRDITERKKQEQTLREAEEANRRNLNELNAIVTQMTEGVAIFDRQ